MSKTHSLVASPLKARSIARSRRDNSFATANSLGSYEAGQGLTRFQARGSIGKSDPADVYKFTAFAGAAAASGSDRLKVINGSLRVSTYLDVGTGLQLFSRFRAGRGTRSFRSEGFPPLPFAVDTYVVFDRPTQNTRYVYRAILRPV